MTAKSFHELTAQREALDSETNLYRIGLRSPRQFADFLRRLEGESPSESTRVRAAWEAHVQASEPESRSKLGSMWRCQLAPHMDGLAVIDLTYAVMAAFERAHIREGYAPKTTHDAFHTLATAIRRAGCPLPWRSEDGTLWRPTRSAKRPKHVRPPFNLGELEALIVATRGRGDLPHRIAVLALCAMRQGEGAGLGWDSVHDGDPVPWLAIRFQAKDGWRTHHPDWTRPIYPPKGKRERTIALHPTAVAALVSQREALRARGWYRPDGPVFPVRGGQWKSNANCIKPEIFKALTAAAGIVNSDAYVPHSLRHTAATLENRGGLDLKSIQGRTGHESLQVLEGYIHAHGGGALIESAIPELAVRFDDDREEASE